MKPPFATDREKHIHMARIFIEQARATSIPSRAAKYLEWAANRRRLAGVSEQAERKADNDQMELFA